MVAVKPTATGKFVHKCLKKLVEPFFSHYLAKKKQNCLKHSL